MASKKGKRVKQHYYTHNIQFWQNIKLYKHENETVKHIKYTRNIQAGYSESTTQTRCRIIQRSLVSICIKFDRIVARHNCGLFLVMENHWLFLRYCNSCKRTANKVNQFKNHLFTAFQTKTAHLQRGSAVVAQSSSCPVWGWQAESN